MTSEERRAVGHRIRVVRERHGWCRDELARRLGVHAGSIARWETGGAVPHGYTVQRIAELGGTTAEWLRTGHPPSAPHPAPATAPSDAGSSATAHPANAAKGADQPNPPGAAHGSDAAETRPKTVEDPFTSYPAVLSFVSGIAPPGREPLRKLDALDGLRRMLTARGPLPSWWYGVREQVAAGKL